MNTSVGDMIEVHGRHGDDLPRRGEVLEVRGKDGGPPYLVQWDDNPHVRIYFSGSDGRKCITSTTVQRRAMPEVPDARHSSHGQTPVTRLCR